MLGIDAGGTKTVCQLADESGEVLAEARRGGANLQAIGEFEVEKVLFDVMEEAIGDLDVRPAAVCLGIAGVDRPDDARVVRGIMKRIGYKAKLLVVNDALVALEAGAPEQPGVVVIAGTGSIAYGRNERNQAARAGGWGYMLGDEGSGYWIGRAALRAVLREADRRGPATQLTGLLLNYYGVARAQDLIHQVYHGALRPRGYRLARAMRTGRLHRRRHRGHRHPPRLRRPARVVGDLGRDAPRARRLGVSVRAVGRHLPRGAVARGGTVAPPAAGVSAQPHILLDEEPAAGAVRLALAVARGGYSVPAYRAD